MHVVDSKGTVSDKLENIRVTHRIEQILCRLLCNLLGEGLFFWLRNDHSGRVIEG